MCSISLVRGDIAWISNIGNQPFAHCAHVPGATGFIVMQIDFVLANP
jgi:hypothetical protein